MRDSKGEQSAQNEVAMRRFAVEMVFSRLALPPEIVPVTRQLQDAYIASGLEPGRGRQAHGAFFADFTARALPFSSTADQQRLARVLTETFVPEERGIPASCLVTVVLAVGLLMAYGVVALLVLGSEAFAESQVGQALIATFITMTVGMSGLLFLRRRMRHPLGLLQLAAIAIIAGAILFVALNSGTLDISRGSLETAEGREQGASMLLFALMAAGAAVLYVRRIVSGLLRLVVLVILLGGAAFFAAQAGLIDLDALRDTLNGLQQP